MTSKVVAVTGGIGSGKSEVMRYLNSLGYSTLDCDKLAMEVATRPNVLEQVTDLLGEGYVVNGQLDRKAIRSRV
ncbi:MAG: dephospho-CoA kinase, partial [Clostridia bacterium]|nr:dephospho-CoA kinase [Clostridia bacterium]